MPFTDVYIGELEDPRFDWECQRPDSWSGNCPKRISPFFPGGFSEVVKAIESREIEGKQVDFAGWVAPMFPAEINAFFVDRYGSNWLEPVADLPEHMNANRRDLKQFLAELNPSKRYAVVASEL